MKQELYEAILRGDRNAVTVLVGNCLAEGNDLELLLNGTMVPAMREMGRRFSCGEAYVPDMLIAARAMQAGLDLLAPHLAGSGHRAAGQVCIGTVKGDLHDIGKNLVAMMLKGAGYEVIDLGVDCDVARFEQGVGAGARAVLCSALLTTTMPYMKRVVEHFRDRPEISVIVGGAPVTRDYAEQIGAHGYGADANEAVKTVDALFGRGA
jgi:5-methyltetrahydrofolate--homocysteine methyltransferase